MTQKQRKWVPSWHNFDSAVASNFSFPQRIELSDYTVEGDGEEMAGMVFTRDERLDIARLLDQVGVHSIVASHITSKSDEGVQTAREISHLGLDAKVEAHLGPNKQAVDLALKTDVSGVHMGVQIDAVRKRNSWQSRQEKLDEAIDVASYAKKHGLNVTFVLRDAARVSKNLLKQFTDAADACGAIDCIGVADSWGVASPEGFGHIVRMVRRWTKVPILIHCHNDFGLATANALAGLSAGASIVTTTVNGIGERCGLSSLEEVALSLLVLYDISLGIKYNKLYELSTLVERATGPMISKLKPIVGERAFSFESDELAQNTLSMRAYDPSFVGNDFRFFPGQRSGEKSIKWVAKRADVKLKEEQIKNLAVKMRYLSKRKRQPTSREFSAMLTKMKRA